MVGRLTLYLLKQGLDNSLVEPNSLHTSRATFLDLISLSCCYLCLIGLLFAAATVWKPAGPLLNEYFTASTHNKPPMIARWIRYTILAVQPCNNSSSYLIKPRGEERPRVLSLTFLAPPPLQLLCSGDSHCFSSAAPKKKKTQRPRRRRLREAGEIKPPFALRNFMHYSALGWIVSPRQLLGGRRGDNC